MGLCYSNKLEIVYDIDVFRSCQKGGISWFTTHLHDVICDTSDAWNDTCRFLSKKSISQKTEREHWNLYILFSFLYFFYWTFPFLLNISISNGRKVMIPRHLLRLMLNFTCLILSSSLFINYVNVIDVYFMLFR